MLATILFTNLENHRGVVQHNGSTLRVTRGTSHRNGVGIRLQLFLHLGQSISALEHNHVLSLHSFDQLCIRLDPLLSLKKTARVGQQKKAPQSHLHEKMGIWRKNG